MNFYLISFCVLYSLDCLEGIAGLNWGDDDSQSDYHLPSKIILSNIIRQQNRPAYIQKIKSYENAMMENLEANIFAQFLNRFQPALDRETKKVEMPKNIDNLALISPEKSDIPLWRTARDMADPRLGKKMTQCTRVPGRILCKFGPYTYVINTRKRDLDNEELEKVVGMMHQRIQEGDKAFDLSIISSKEKPGANLKSSFEPILFPTEAAANFDSPPIIVECSPSDKIRAKLSADSDKVEEITYSCKWHSLKLKRELKPNNSTRKEKKETFIFATPVAKTCSTQIYVRKFSDVCTMESCWCPETTVTECSTPQLPYCVPWCNPCLEKSNNPKNKIKQKRSIEKNQ